MKRYEKYKNSGVDWIGEIPEGWEILPGLNFIYENKDKNKGMIRNSVLSLSYGKIRCKDERELTGLVPESFETYQFVNVGDLIFRPTDLQNDMVSLRSSISEFEGIITSAYLNLRFKKIADSKFYHYFFRAIDNNKIIYGLGSGLRQNISYLDFRRFLFPFPPLSEQQSIALFLDEKTAKIDQTISIKEKEILLLKERRQILIQKAVTKGLNPKVKLKNSGVDWIGEIPEHWEVRKLKYCLNSKLKYGANESGVEYNPDLPRYVRITDFGFDGDLSEEKKLSLTWKQGSDYLLSDGDILFARSGATVGKSYQFKTSMSIEKYYAFAGYLIKAEPNENLIFSDYLYLYTNSSLFDNWKSAIFSKATIENIGADKYSGLLVVVPPINEQKEILENYFLKNEKIAKAISLKQQEIEKLKEYKTVLVDNVVTGKVRV